MKNHRIVRWVTFRALEFRSVEKTLTDDEVGRTFQRIVDALKATAGIEVRES